MSVFDMLVDLAAYNYPFQVHPVLPPILTAIFAFALTIVLATRREEFLAAVCGVNMLFLASGALVLAFRPYSTWPYVVMLAIGTMVVTMTILACIGRLFFGFAWRNMAWWPKSYLVASCMVALISVSATITVWFSIVGYALTLPTLAAQVDAFGVLNDWLLAAMGANLLVLANLVIAGILCLALTAIRRKRANGQQRSEPVGNTSSSDGRADC